MANGILNPIPRLEASFRSGSSVLVVGPADTWDMEPLVDELVRRAPRASESVSMSAIELGGMFFGSPPGLSLAPNQVRQIAQMRTSLTIALRTTDVGVIGREPPSSARSSERTTVSVSFRVKGLFEPGDFGLRVGLQPTKMSRRQDKRRLMARVSTWRLEFGPIVASEFPTSATDQLLSQVMPHAEEIKAAVEASATRSAVHFAGTYGDVVPKLTVTRQQFAAIAELACWVDFSVMVVRESGDILEF